MVQLGELQEIWGEFEERGVQVLAIAKETGDLSELEKTAARFPDRPFVLLGAVEGRGVERYARTTGYLLDSDGIVKQVFPMETYNRPRWWAVLHEIDRIFGEE
jgi:hypothetical protein